MYIGEGVPYVHRGGGYPMYTIFLKKRLLYVYKGKFWEPLDLYMGGTICTCHHLTPPHRPSLGVFCLLVCSCNRYGSQKKLKPRPMTSGLAGCHKNAIFGQFFTGPGPDLVEHRTL